MNTTIKEKISENVNLCSNPSELKITDIRVANINGAPKHCPLIKVYTNQGLVGYGEVRDASSATYALMLKSRLIGENPCNVDKIFRRIKQFGGPSRQGRLPVRTLRLFPNMSLCGPCRSIRPS